MWLIPVQYERIARAAGNAIIDFGFGIFGIFGFGFVYIISQLRD